jgi:hypothetical protein
MAHDPCIALQLDWFSAENQPMNKQGTVFRSAQMSRD